MSGGELIRTLIVDDSAFTRKVLRDVLARAPDITVVGIARDGLEALEKIAELKPDVVTLDLAMPMLDGTGVLQALPAEGAPRVVVVSTAMADSARAIEALQAGAVHLIHKPTALATDQLYELSSELIDAVRTAYASRARHPAPPRSVVPPPQSYPPTRVDLVAIGTSTGGPQALTAVLTRLPKNFPVPVAVALHIPAGYTEALARRLDQVCEVEVVEARTGLELTPGRVLIACAGTHLKFASRSGVLTAVNDLEPRGTAHHPSVDVMFESAAAALGGRCLGVVLTGMGADGLRGATLLRERGAPVITEAQSSCVVYGMPRAVKEAGHSVAEAPLEEIASTIERFM